MAKPDASNDARDQALQAGMHHDGMHFFPLDGRNDHGLLALNHEYTDERLLHPGGAANWGRAEAEKSMEAVGVSVIEVRAVNGRDPVQLTARTSINRKDFGMTAYSVVVGETVTITIEARLMPG